MENIVCLCLSCYKKHTCDFSLSAWAAKSRLDSQGVRVRFTTTECSRWKQGDYDA